MHVQLLLTTSGDTLLTILWNKLNQNKRKKTNSLQPLQYEIFKVIYIASLYLKKKQMKLQKPAAIYYINEDF